MCGIFGGVGEDVDPVIIRGLAWANLSRGKDSTGFFNSASTILKMAKPSDAALRLDDVTKFIRTAASDGMVIGHTRKGTRGPNIDANAHPFQYGSIVGVHNGMVDASETYAVDSMYIFDMLNRHNGDYQAALKDLSGYMAVAWYDGEAVTLLAHNHYCHYGRIGNTTYFSSDDLPLEMFGVEGVLKLENQVVRIDKHGAVTALPKLDGLPYIEPNYNCYYGGGKDHIDSSVWVSGVRVQADTLFVLKFVPLPNCSITKD